VKFLAVFILALCAVAPVDQPPTPTPPTIPAAAPRFDHRPCYVEIGGTVYLERCTLY
jgi:hypothetical protein